MKSRMNRDVLRENKKLSESVQSQTSSVQDSQGDVSFLQPIAEHGEDEEEGFKEITRKAHRRTASQQMTLGGFKNKLKVNLTNILSTSGVEEGRVEGNDSEFGKGTGLDLTMVRAKRASGAAKTGLMQAQMAVGSGADSTGKANGMEVLYMSPDKANKTENPYLH